MKTAHKCVSVQVFRDEEMLNPFFCSALSLSAKQNASLLPSLQKLRMFSREKSLLALLLPLLFSGVLDAPSLPLLLPETTQHAVKCLNQTVTFYVATNKVIVVSRMHLARKTYQRTTKPKEPSMEKDFLCVAASTAACCTKLLEAVESMNET